MKYYYFPLTTALLLSYGEIINNLNLFKIYGKNSLKRDNSVGE